MAMPDRKSATAPHHLRPMVSSMGMVRMSAGISSAAEMANVV